MTSTIKQLISEGEHQQQDFKFGVLSYAKIARSLAAFANTDGGRLLLGVKDNGLIAGVKTDEEIYMIDGAANMYCQPPVKFSSKQHIIESKIVLEIEIPKSDNKFHKAPNKSGDFKVYIRQDDQNFIANRIFLRSESLRKKGKTARIKYTKEVQYLLQEIEDNGSITYSKFRDKTKLSKDACDFILVNLLLMDVLQSQFTENECFYVKIRSEIRS